MMFWKRDNLEIESLKRENKELKERIDKYKSRKYHPSIECVGCAHLIEAKRYSAYGQYMQYNCKKNNECAEFLMGSENPTTKEG